MRLFFSCNHCRSFLRPQLWRCGFVCYYMIHNKWVVVLLFHNMHVLITKGTPWTRGMWDIAQHEQCRAVSWQAKCEGGGLADATAQSAETILSYDTDYQLYCRIYCIVRNVDCTVLQYYAVPYCKLIRTFYCSVQ